MNVTTRVKILVLLLYTRFAVPVAADAFEGASLAPFSVAVNNRSTLNVAALVADNPATSTEMVPVVASDGTDVVMLVAVLADTTAAVPLNLTVLFAGVVLKFVPVIVTVFP